MLPRARRCLLCHPFLQIAACPEVTVVSVADVPADVLEKEKAIEMEKEDIKSKPEAIRCVCWRGAAGLAAVGHRCCAARVL